jgi:hypothetical protein
MTSMQVDLPVLSKAGNEFTFQASRLTVAVNAYAAGAQIPSSAIGSIGPGQGVLDAYEGLHARVTEHLHSLRRIVEETGRHLATCAVAYEQIDRVNHDRMKRAGTLAHR